MPIDVTSTEETLAGIAESMVVAFEELAGYPLYDSSGELDDEDVYLPLRSFLSLAKRYRLLEAVALAAADCNCWNEWGDLAERLQFALNALETGKIPE